VSGSGFLYLVENAALLLVLAYLYDLIVRLLRAQTLLVKVLTGTVLGGISVALMLASWRLESGVIFDTRSVALSTGTLFFGTVPGLIAGAIAAAYRITQGGSGALAGTSVIAMSVAVGVAWRHLRRIWVRDPGVLELYLFGLTVHACMLLLMFLLPWPSPLAVLREISIPVIVIYPLATVALGLLLVDQRRRRRSEEALRESEERNRAIIAALPGGLVTITDLDGRYELVEGDELRALGLDGPPLVGLRIDEVLESRAAALVQQQLERVKQGETMRFQGENLGQTYLVTAAPLRDTEGRISHVLTLSVNISDRRRAEDEVRRLNVELEERVRRRTLELERAQEEMEAFAYSVAHDLRAPLRAVDGFTALIAEDNAGSLNADSLADMQRVRAAVQRMGHLIDDLLRLSRLSRQELVPRVVDLTAMAREISAGFTRREPGRRVDVEVVPGLAAIGDGELLRVVMGNLLENSWKFTAEQPAARIEVGALDVDGERAIFVRDNGVGFDQAYASKLFLPFERLHGDDRFAGTGIGLASVARIVARHHGRVWAESVEGEGAAFYFTLGEVE
jgi:signal transduction histidine kinase